LQLASKDSLHYQRYHADKHPASVYREDWAVMAEEISKALGSCYTSMEEWIVLQ